VLTYTDDFLVSSSSLSLDVLPGLKCVDKRLYWLSTCHW